ncbi:unnamed protein product [Brugia timori]|uniref:Uncharacterized protein n=1 Tax=Brugia timori TaxID=42155 RepID=A0A0R3QTE4_9BILA|nr:unnamed protein product [Brugia timori]
MVILLGYRNFDPELSHVTPGTADSICSARPSFETKIEGRGFESIRHTGVVCDKESSFERLRKGAVDRKITIKEKQISVLF